MTAFSPGDIIAILTGVAVIVANGGVAYVQISKAREDSAHSRDERARNAAAIAEQMLKQNKTLIALHTSTNGLAARAEDLAKEVGRLQGKADEKANPTP